EEGKVTESSSWKCVFLRDHDCSEEVEDGVFHTVEGIGFVGWRLGTLPFVPAGGMDLGYDGEEGLGGGRRFETTLKDRIVSVACNVDHDWFEVTLSHHGVPLSFTVEDMKRVYPGWKFIHYHDDDSYFAALQNRHRLIRGVKGAVAAAGATPRQRRR